MINNEDFKCIVCPKCQEASIQVDAIEDVYWCECGYVSLVDYLECPKEILEKFRE